MTIDEALVALKINREETLARFSDNLELLTYFIRKFPTDETYPALLKSMEAKDWPKIETDAHTLKGLSGNLGFSELYKLSTALVQAVREKKYDVAEKLEPELINSCNEIIKIIDAIDK